MSRCCSSLCAALVVLAPSGAVGAQVLATDPAGFPVRQFQVALPGNTDVELTTDSPSTGGALTDFPGYYADSVLSVRPVLSGVSVAGSDGCGAAIRPSCFTFHTAGTTGSTQQYVVMLRAWRAQSPGSTRLWWRVAGSPTFTPIGSGLMTFGGGTADVTIPSGTTRVRFDTVLEPGGSTSHQIWLVETNEWRTRRVVINHAGIVADTATDDFNPSAFGLSGAFRLVYAGDVGAGALSLVRNEAWVWDADGDGLSNALERSLRTCDATTDPSPSPGFSCNALPGCPGNGDFTTDTALCRSSRRDTDHDGLRDFDELYGVDHPLLYLPLWGSEAAQMDVFVEMDQADQDPGDEDCDVVTTVNDLGGSASVDFFARVNDVYGDAPPSLNPGGASGVRVHWDMGIAAPSLANTDYGSWGGGRDCGAAAAMSPTRLGYFHHAVDRPGSAGGDGAVGGFDWTVGTLAGHVHELGHNLGIWHSGPAGSAGGGSDFDNGGSRASYPSRMNYRFMYVGGSFGGSGADWTRMSFSFGRWPALDVGASLETCPMGSADLSGDVSVLALGSPPEVVSWNPTAFGGLGCWNVDWNQTGGPPVGTTYHRAMARVQHINRQSAVEHLSRPHRIHSAGDAAVVNDVLVFARAELESGSTFRVALHGDGADDDCSVYPAPVTSPPPPVDDTWSNNGTYNGCFRVGTSTIHPTDVGGTPLRADGLSIASAALPGGGRGLLLVTNVAGQARWSRGNLVSAVGAAEMSLSLGVRDTSIGGGLATGAGRRDPALVQVPGSDESLLLYLRADGVVAQRSLVAAGSAWTAETVSLAGGSSIASNASPDLVVFNGEVYMTTSFGSSGTVRLYQLATSGSPASARSWTLVHTLPQYTTFRRPTIAAYADPDAPPAWRMVLLLAGTDGVMYWAQGPLGSAGTTSGEWMAPVGYFDGGDGTGAQRAIEAAASAWDDRVAVSAAMRNLRVFRYPNIPDWFECPGTESCLVGTTCTQPYATSPVRACMTASGDVTAAIELDPFPVGPLPGVYADYNDWRQFGIGLCRSLRGAVGTADSECGTLLRWPEPTSGGMSIVGASTPADRSLHPWLYTSSSATCPGL